MQPNNLHFLQANFYKHQTNGNLFTDKSHNTLHNFTYLHIYLPTKQQANKLFLVSLPGITHYKKYPQFDIFQRHTIISTNRYLQNKQLNLKTPDNTDHFYPDSVP